MGDDGVARPSLFLVSTEKAHREHLHQHNFFHQNKRQAATEIDVQQIVTEVVQTVSFIQQIEVDSNGSTISVQTVLADATDSGYVSATTDASSTATTTDPASPGVTNTASSASSTVVEPLQAESSSQSLPFNLSATSTSSSASSIPTSSFALLTVSSNSTTLISSSSSQIRNFSNSTITSSSSSSSFTYISSSSSTSSDESSYFTSSSLYPTYFSSDSNATPTSGGVGGAGGTGAATGSTSTSTTAAGNETSSDSSTAPSTSTVVGGVVGGVAGAAIFIFLLMLLLRWKKRHQNMLSLSSGDPFSGGTTSRGIGAPPPSEPSGGMSGPRASMFAVPAALATLTGFKRSSRQTDQTISTDGGGETGFYRVSGRKLPSVFSSGGDGYGDNVVDNTLSGSSFYRDSDGFYGGPSSPTLAAPVKKQRPESGIPVMRPSPARTPVTEQSPFAFGPAPLTPPSRPDVLGRSHPSQDGSHASRFTEEV